MSEPTVGPINQPGVFNIHAWDGRRWRGGMNRVRETDAISVAIAWSTQSGQRHRVYSPDGELVFDSEATAMLSEFIKASRAMYSAMEARTEWDEGCLYYNGVSAPELEEPMTFMAAALARVGGSS